MWRPDVRSVGGGDPLRYFPHVPRSTHEGVMHTHTVASLLAVVYVVTVYVCLWKCIEGGANQRSLVLHQLKKEGENFPLQLPSSIGQTRRIIDRRGHTIVHFCVSVLSFNHHQRPVDVDILSFHILIFFPEMYRNVISIGR